MTNADAARNNKPIEIAAVLTEELRCTRPDKKFANDNLRTVFGTLHDQNLTALCFSGGGIRSATFGLGIVQALAKHGLLDKIDYLSTVSGGGYLGSWLSAWVHRAAKDKPTPEEAGIDPRDLGITRVQSRINCSPLDSTSPNPEAGELQHLREFSNYMSPKTGLLSADTWTLVALYLRNLFLNLTIFIPLLAAVLILPRLLYRALIPPSDDLSSLAWKILVASMAAGAMAITFVVLSLPSTRAARGKSGSSTQSSGTEMPQKPLFQSDAGVLLAGVLPLLLSAFLASMLWAWNYRLGDRIATEYGLGTTISIWFFLAAAAGAYGFGTLAYLALNGWKNFKFWGSVACLLSSLIGGFLLWLVSQRLLDREKMAEFGSVLTGFEWQLYLSLSVPLFLLIVLVAATLFIGLSSKIMTDEDREWLARYGGWIMIVGSVWISLNAVVLIFPSLVSMVYRGVYSGSLWDAIAPTVLTLTGIVSAVISLVGGFSGQSKIREEPGQSRTSKLLAVAPKFAAFIFLGFILVGLAALATGLFYAVGLSSVASHAGSLNEVGTIELVLAFLALAVVGIVMACFVNVNKFSLHGAYRDRLVRAYLGASNRDRDQTTFTGFDEADNLQLHELGDQRPLHIINATVNLVAGDNLAWQNRKAASFTMSALHCGTWAVGGYRRSADYCVSRSARKALRLGTAMAISGAAANPNMGYYSSPVVTFLMSLFNIRLGWWLGNTGPRGSLWDRYTGQYFFEKATPSVAVLPLINETFGRTDEHKKFLMVTDGGHFENLALYEMVLRRCRLIVLSDGAADADFKFGEIANAIQKCKVDLGVDIKLLGSMRIRSRYSPPDETEAKGARFAIALITYPEFDDNGEHRYGWLIYTRPTYYGKDEPRNIQYYADSNLKFPHQSTGDQMYDEQQFEAYRGLGFLTMDEIIGRRRRGKPADLMEIIEDEVRLLAKKDPDLLRVANYVFGAKPAHE